MSEWVEIDVREPAVDENVLFWRREWAMPNVGYRSVHQQYRLVGLGGSLANGNQPTHWMPLPEPPKLPTPPPTPLTWARVDRVEPESFETVLLWNEGWGRTLLGHRTISSEYVDIESEPFDPGPTHWMWFPNKGPTDE